MVLSVCDTFICFEVPELRLRLKPLISNGINFAPYFMPMPQWHGTHILKSELQMVRILTITTVILFSTSLLQAEEPKPTRESCMKMCQECAEICKTTMTHCMNEADAKHKDCAKVCEMCHHACLMCAAAHECDSPLSSEIAKVCMKVCKSCAESCTAMDDPTCKKCAKMCNDCSKQCKAMSQAK